MLYLLVWIEPLKGFIIAKNINEIESETATNLVPISN